MSAAAAGGMPIAARSGGHSYAGYSTPDSALIVDLSGMSNVPVNARWHGGLIDGLGGAVGRVESADPAFPHRGTLATMQIYVKTTLADRTAAASTVAHVRDRLTGIVGDGAYVNYLDDSMPNWARACYGDNLPRLGQIAQCYDPDRVFTFPQGIVNS